MNMEIKVGDKVRVSKDAPEMYFFGCNYDNSDFKVILVDRDNAVITQVKNGSFAIPTKYLTKVEDEVKEPKLKYSVGQKVILHFYGGEVSEIIEAYNDGSVWNKYKVKALPHRVWNENELDPYTEPTELVQPKEQTEAEEDARIRQLEAELDEFRKAELDRVSHPEKYHTYEVTIDNVAMDWQRYEADLAKEIAVKLSKPNENKPGYVADYAVSVAKAVVENLKKK